MSNVGTDNPYAAPTALVADAPAPLDADIEQLRRDHVRHERQLKSIGSLYWLGAILMGLVLVIMMSTMLFSNDGEPTIEGRGIAGILVFALVFYGGAAVVSATIAYGLSTLRSWVRIPAIILSCLGLFAIPIGTLINGYALYLLLSQRGATILKPGYAAVIAATPHIKYRRSFRDWLALVIAVLLVAAVVGFFFWLGATA